eukprot:2028691-Prymnesium_polylepis.1
MRHSVASARLAPHASCRGGGAVGGCSGDVAGGGSGAACGRLCVSGGCARRIARGLHVLSLAASGCAPPPRCCKAGLGGATT